MVRTKKFRFIEGGLAGDVYLNRDNPSPDRVAVFLYGFPAFPGPNPGIEALLAAGYIVIQPHYWGTYDSEGLFSGETMVSTSAALCALVARGYLTQSKGETRFPLSPRITLCVGHSFGAAAAIRSVRDMPDLTTLVLLSPTAHYSTSQPDFGVREDGPSHLSYVRSSHPHTYRLADDSEWEILKGQDPIPNSPYPNALERSILVFGELDTYFDIPQAVQAMPGLVTAYCGDGLKVETRVIPGRGHPVSELVGSDGGFDLERYAAGLMQKR